MTKTAAVLNSCSRILLLQSMHCLIRPQFQLFCRSMRICPVSCYQSLCCCITRHFLARIRTAKFFTKSSQQFLFDLVFENKKTFCSWTNHVRTCKDFEQPQWAKSQKQGWPSFSAMGEGWRFHYTGLDLLLVSFLYCSTWSSVRYFILKQRNIKPLV
jgi:hypothetical protein